MNEETAEVANYEDRPKQYTIYRANKAGNGVAFQWQFVYKPNNKRDKWNIFLETAKQIGMDDNENAKFDWDNKITVKIGVNDLGELLAVLTGRKQFVGTKGSLFHETPSGGNKVIEFKEAENGSYMISVSAQDAEKKPLGKASQYISGAEASILQALLTKALYTMYGW